MESVLRQGNRLLQRAVSCLAAFALLCALSWVSAPVARADAATLTVGYADCDGISVDEQGNYSGYAVSYLEKISEYTGWNYDYVLDSWENCLGALERGEVDLLVMTAYTSERAGYLLYSDLAMGSNYPVLYAAPQSDIFYQDYAAFDGCRIGVTVDTIFESSLIAHVEELGIHCDIVRFRTEAETKAALDRGDIELMAVSVLAPHTDVKLVDQFHAAPSYIVSNPDNRQLMDQINAAMQQIEIHHPDLESELEREFYNKDQSITNLYITREEQQYLDSLGPVLVKGHDIHRPMTYGDGNGGLQGVLVDYLNYLGAMMGVEFVYESGDYPLIAENVDSMSEEGYLLLSLNQHLEQKESRDSFYQSRNLLDTTLAFVRRQGEYVTKYDKHTFAITGEMQYLAELLLGTNSESTILFYADSEACMEAVLGGTVEMAILDEQEAAYWLQKPVYREKLQQVAGSGAYIGGACVYAPEQHRLLVQILNKALDHVSEAQRAYRVNTFAQSHTYEYQIEDLLHEYGSVMLVSATALLVFVVLLLILRRTRRQKVEADAQLHLLQRDKLTGTYSREYFMEQAQEMIRKESAELYIVRLNVCHFKIINELCGTEKGDRLLREIAAALKGLSEKYGFLVGRFAADHFYLCIRRRDFEQIEFAGKAPTQWLGTDVALVYGVYPVEKESSVQTMCDRANMAITHSRHGASAFIHYYNDSFRRQLLQEQEIESEMEAALAARQFCIYVQPKFDVETDQIVGGEALVRWKHPQKGMIPPAEFVELFEKNGFIIPLDHFVWEESCRFLAEAKEKGLPQVPLSINVSRLHFYHGELQTKLTELLENYHLEPKDLELEITESVYAEEPEIVSEQCGQLQKLGFRIAMDDFGSGISSLNMLRRMPLNVLKMDLKFLEDDADRERTVKGRGILRAQIELAHSIGLDVVVEGLETLEQQKFVREIGKCAAQGYYYAKPLSTDAFAALLRQRNADPVGLPAYGTADALRRERLRQEQLRPLLETISASDNIFGYLLPEKTGILSQQLAKLRKCPQRVPHIEKLLTVTDSISAESAAQWLRLFDAVDRGERSGAAIVEYVDDLGCKSLQWIRFDLMLDFEGNPLIAMFSISDFGEISSRVEELISSRQALAEK